MSNKFSRFIEAAGDAGVGIAKGFGKLRLGFGDSMSGGAVSKYLVREAERGAWTKGLGYGVGKGVGSTIRGAGAATEQAINGVATAGRNMWNSPLLFKNHERDMLHWTGKEVQPWILGPLVVAAIPIGYNVFSNKFSAATSIASYSQPPLNVMEPNILPTDDLNSGGIVQSLHNKYRR